MFTKLKTNDIFLNKERTMTEIDDKLYQDAFNTALYKMRIATNAVFMDSEPLMRTLCKIWYDFSDEIRGKKNYDRQTRLH